jgi:parvulin-like peptidyl-prolyl isomerase
MNIILGELIKYMPISSIILIILFITILYWIIKGIIKVIGLIKEYLRSPFLVTRTEFNQEVINRKKEDEELHNKLDTKLNKTDFNTIIKDLLDKYGTIKEVQKDLGIQFSNFKEEIRETIDESNERQREAQKQDIKDILIEQKNDIKSIFETIMHNRRKTD